MGKRAQREYTWHESMSGWEAARIGYAKQEAARAAAAAAERAKRPKTRADWMDEGARRDFAHMDRVNAEGRELTRKIMTAPGLPHEPQPSTGNEPWRAYVLDDAIGRALRRLRR